ncbi:MAG: hypothetical protein AAB019_02475 [Planctomycetota bacterium]
MRSLEDIKQRYLRDPISIRLGGLAANLLRVSSFAEHPDNQKAVSNLLRESEFFIEWAAPDAEVETQAKLAELQLQLALYYQRLSEIYQIQSERERLIKQSKQWSDEILNLSGLLESL